VISDHPRPFRQFGEFLGTLAFALVIGAYAYEYKGENPWWLTLFLIVMVFFTWDEFTDWLEELDKSRAFRVDPLRYERDQLRRYEDREEL
jgi:hypothetical protein